MKNTKYKYKNYAHFDRKIGYKSCESRIKSKNFINKHAFYPFIYFENKIIKYNSKAEFKQDRKKIKVRKLYYSAHIDRYIYQYYGMQLNELYNKRAKQLDIDDVVIAYRTNKKGLSNINFSKEVIEFIAKQKKCLIFVGDFSCYYDTLDHNYLKEKIIQLIGQTKLPNDHYTIYKNITKFCYINLEDILKVKNKSLKNLNKLDLLFSPKDFRNFKKEYKHVNKENYGIPQGSAISAIYSNIYLMDFDRLLKKYVDKRNGLYRRYCDDMIVIIPLDNSNLLNEDKLDMFMLSKDILRMIKSIKNLKVNEAKIQKLVYRDNTIFNNNMKEDKLDYLGFTFDGKRVKIREKSITKYYYKTRRAINFANNFSQQKNRKSLRKKLFTTYSHLGVSRDNLGKIRTFTIDKNKNKKHGNFVTYVYRSQQIFDIDKCTENEMKKQIKNHWKFINNRLEKHEPNQVKFNI